MTPADILAAARECLGTPFAHQGRIAGVGLDCAGLVCHVAQRLGLQYDAPTNYPRQPYHGLLQQTLDAQPCLRTVEHMQPGDVLLMRFRTDPQHLAITTGDGLIHAYQAAGKCCEHGLDAAWRARIVGIYRFEGVE